ncbi:uncharacterized protein C2845_PM17G06720 [Panicum miliaceum]|uniref:Uncharacterized protein n=1 Tax=Panicum miliaceum TaxID=4540 RepID=A0A3L6Q0F0_PANMI|nr:uncharacterized protein C2845_PM17G06720 [Panicum miliaceum]
MVQCMEGQDVVRLVHATLDRGQIDFQNLCTFKDQLGYGERDYYYYYKKRIGDANASVQAIDYSKDVEYMLEYMAESEERKLRGQAQPTEVRDGSNGSSATPLSQWPTHARKPKQIKGGMKMGRGCLKGLAAVAKRSKSQSQKMKIQFSENMGGPYGDNRRTFVDEVVLLTKQKAPLIGVSYWRDVSRHVKEDIAECIMDHWDLETTKNPKKKIWKVAMERYKGWQSALHAAYKAYNSYDKRIKNKPEDIDIMEWHYLKKYFATRQFKSKSSNNSQNHKQLKTSHLGGSKPFSQWSWEKRDPVTGAEPCLLEIWRTTHSTRGGEWTDEVAESIYEKVEKHEANKAAEMEQLKAAFRQELMGEFETLMAPYRQALLPEHTPETNTNTIVDEAGSTDDNIVATQIVHSQQLAK